MPIPLLIGGALLSAAGSIGGAVVAGNARAQGHAAQQRVIDEMSARLDAMGLPELKEWIPEFMQEAESGKIQADPRYRQAQMEVLQQLQDVSRGEDMQTRAQINQITQEAMQADQAMQQGLLGQMRARGAADSGAHLAAALSGQQARAGQMKQMGTSLAGQAQQRALQAMTQRGALAGQMGAQDFSQRMQAAQARDAISRYNTELMNRAQLYNLAIPQQQWQNQMQQHQLRAGIAGQQMGLHGRQAEAAAQQAAGIGAGISSLGQTAMGIGSGMLQNQAAQQAAQLQQHQQVAQQIRPVAPAPAMRPFTSVASAAPGIGQQYTGYAIPTTPRTTMPASPYAPPGSSAGYHTYGGI